MSLQVPAPADGKIRPVDEKVALKSGNTLASTGYYQWLEWLQRLLHAQSLVLFTCEGPQQDNTYRSVGCLPRNVGVSAAQMQLVERCASEQAVVSVKSENTSEASLVCIPDVMQKGCKQPDYILLIRRSAPTKLEMRVQARLVRWAYHSISAYNKIDPPLVTKSMTPPGRLISWCITQVGKQKPLSQSLAGLMNELQALVDAEYCYASRLHTRKKKVKKISLVAISGKRKIDPRLPLSETVLCAVRDAYRQKSIPLARKYDEKVLSCLPETLRVNDSGKFCNRLIMPLTISEQHFAVTIEWKNRVSGNDEQVRICTELRSAMFLLLSSDPEMLGVTAALKRVVSDVYSRMTKHTSRTLLLILASLVVLFVLIAPAEHRISARLSVEASEHQVLIAPVDGFVKSVKAKAGDKVHEGEVLAALDDVDLQLQQQSLESESQQNQQAYARSLANQDRMEITRLKEESALIDTRLAQLSVQQERMTIRAPIDGVVLSGSWEDFEGASVAAGDTLFTIGSTSSPRLVLNVSEYDVNRIAVGQTIAIRMSADPSTVHEASVTAVLPIAIPSEGKNIVQVHAAMNHHTALRPGMLGIGKVLVGKKARLHQWFERGVSRIIWLAWKTGVLK